MLNEGQIVLDTYQVEQRLGEGAFAIVYRVKHKYLGRMAMKVFKTAGLSSAEILKNLDEAVLLSQLDHPNIIRMFDANVVELVSGRHAFFTMEHVAGGNLERFWKSHGGAFVPVATTVEIMRQVCSGIARAHAATPPIVHRDIKPDNILVGYHGSGLRVRVTDFGFAKHVNPLTLLATTLGALAFRAPEGRDPKTFSRAADVWAIGATLYLLLTDRMPYYAPDRPHGADQRRYDKPLVAPSAININADPALDRIVARAVAILPDDRYQSAIEFLDALMQWSAPASDPAKPEIESSSKEVLGGSAGIDASAADELIERAFALSQQPGHLNEAADLLEEAVNMSPGLREHYQYWITLWRRGIVK